MHTLTPSIIAVLFFTLVQLISAQGNSHEKRLSGSLQRRHTTHLAKRFSNARFTYYKVGQGACGHFNQPSDFIVALNSAQYGSGGYCGATITLTYGGKSAQATIVDECPGCPYTGLDLSEGLFSFFAPTSQGTIYGDWVFGSSEEAESTSTTPKSTSTPPPPTTTTTTTSKKHTSTTPQTTSTATTTTTTITTTSSKISSTTSRVPSSTSSSATTTTSSSSSVPSTSPIPADGAETLQELGTVLVQLCTFVEQIFFDTE